jgi:hypothetical protein
MGWGIIIPNVFLSRVRIDELEGRKQGLEDYLITLKTKLYMFAVAEPKITKDVEGGEFNIVDSCYYELSELLDSYDDTIRELQLCELAIANKENLIADE